VMYDLVEFGIFGSFCCACPMFRLYVIFC